MPIPQRMTAKYHTSCHQCGKDCIGQPIVVEHNKWVHDNDICYPAFQLRYPKKPLVIVAKPSRIKQDDFQMSL